MKRSTNRKSVPEGKMGKKQHSYLTSAQNQVGKDMADRKRRQRDAAAARRYMNQMLGRGR